ncbi:MAG: cysteine-rich CWC family protein [Burkholderiales bacterium]|nr:cysteine-rich CWC family protein [Burkholderiales bacterium]
MTCPLCGGPNVCAPAHAGSFAAACWCADATIDPDAIARVPATMRGRACLCPRCAVAPATARAAVAGP